MSALLRRSARVAAAAVAVAVALTPVTAFAAPPSTSCTALGANIARLNVLLDSDPATIDASADPVTVNGAGATCLGAVVVEVRIIGNAVVNRVTVQTGRALPIHGDLGAEADEFAASGPDHVGPLAGGAGADTLRAPVGGSTLAGGGDDDTLEGSVGDDALDGGSGDDVLRPGRGRGTNSGGGGDDTVTYSGVGINVHADISAGQVSTDAVGETLSQRLVDVDNLIGGVGTDILTGNGDRNVLDGGSGTASDTLSGGGEPDVLRGGAGSDTLDGGAGDDTLQGDEGDDALIGGLGADDLQGGAGSADTASYIDRTAPGPGVRASLEGPAGSIDAEGDEFSSIEHLRGGEGDDTLTGSTLADVIDGAGGNDTIFGGAQVDTLRGGPGSDTLSYLSEVSAVVADLRDSPVLPGRSDATAGFENVIGGTSSDTIVGNDAANRLEGNQLDDSLTGLGGDDVLLGGAGDDVLRPGLDGGQNNAGAGTDRLSYDDVGLGVDVDLGPLNSAAAGSATVGGRTQSLFGFTNVTGSPHDDSLTGDQAANVLLGGGGDDRLRGGRGDDTLDGEHDDSPGGAGDTVLYDDLAFSGVSVDLPQGVAITSAGERDTLLRIENLLGSPNADVLTGTSAPNTLDGAGGADVVNGGGDPGDTLIGGTETDTLRYFGVASGVVVNLSGDPLPAPTDSAAGFENVVGGSGEDTIIGDDGPNTLSGLGGADLLDGRGDDDMLDGGDRDDTLKPGSGGGTFSGADGTGDTVSYEGSAVKVEADLRTGVVSGPGLGGTINTSENLVGGDGDDALGGNAAPNILRGGPGADRLSGLAGTDTLQGEQNDDTLIGGTSDDVLQGGDGSADWASYEDRPAGSVVASLAAGTGGIGAEADRYDAIENLRGGGGDDVLTGDGAVNTIEGGAGSDTIAGGPGKDVVKGGESPNDDDLVTFADEPSGIVVHLAGTAPADLPPAGAATEEPSEFESVIGSDDGDTITGDDDANRLVGGEGVDTLWGLGGDDAIQGGDDEDAIRGDAGADTIDGGDDDDVMTGGAGADVLAGGGDDDTVTYDGATDPVSVSLDANANDGIVAPGEGDNVLSTENVVGGAGDDALTGDQAINRLLGGIGDDVLDGGGNDDLLDGQAGTDLASYAGRGVDEPVVATLDGAPRGGAANELDQLARIEGLRGGSGADSLSGGPAGDILEGGPGGDSLLGADGSDAIRGQGGDDAISGGGGGDVLEGGSGADRLDGGLGVDAFSGDDGDDDVAAFDGAVENIRCGAGTDRAAHDLGDTFDLGDCELRRVPSDSELPFVPASVTPRDRDSDGFVETADCNDADPAVRPGAPELVANGVDENCDGADAAPPRLTTTLRSKFSRVRRGMRVRVLELRQVPAGAQIHATCRAQRRPACPFSSRRRTIGAARTTLSLRGWFGDRPLSIGTVIEVRVTASGAIGRSARLTIRRRGTPARAFGCLPPGAARAVSC